jgi:hypothetical protein
MKSTYNHHPFLSVPVIMVCTRKIVPSKYYNCILNNCCCTLSFLMYVLPVLRLTKFHHPKTKTVSLMSFPAKFFKKMDMSVYDKPRKRKDLTLLPRTRWWLLSLGWLQGPAPEVKSNSERLVGPHREYPDHPVKSRNSGAASKVMAWTPPGHEESAAFDICRWSLIFLLVTGALASQTSTITYFFFEGKVRSFGFFSLSGLKKTSFLNYARKLARLKVFVLGQWNFFIHSAKARPHTNEKAQAAAKIMEEAR